MLWAESCEWANNGESVRPAFIIILALKSFPASVPGASIEGPQGPQVEVVGWKWWGPTPRNANHSNVYIPICIALITSNSYRVVYEVSTGKLIVPKYVAFS